MIHFIVISFVIPTLNESMRIEKTIENLFKIISEDDEIIVVDGDSEDDTVERVKRFSGVKCIKSGKRGRAVQMNRGVLEAREDYILFLHADTLIDERGIEKLKKEIEKNEPEWGWFNLKLDSPRFIYRILETIACWRTRIVQEPLGDHAIFVKKATFKKIGGYPEISLMEDVELVNKLKNIARGKRINHYVLSSVRRFEKGGILTTTIIICKLRILYHFGIPANKLKRQYEDFR